MHKLLHALRSLLNSHVFTAGLFLCLAIAPASARAATDDGNTTPLVAARKLFEAQKYPEARAAFEKLAESEPANAEIIFYLGWTAFRLNENEEAIKLLEQATTLDATKSQYFHVLGDAYYNMAVRSVLPFSKGKWAKKSLAAYSRGVAIDPDNLDVRRARCDFYRYAPAIAGGGMDKAYTEAEEIRKRDPLKGLSLFIDLYVHEKKYDAAFEMVDAWLRQHPDSKPALYHLGRLTATTGQQLERGETALKDYLQYTPVGKEPSLSSAHFRLGMIYEKKGDKTAARAEYEAALRLNPDNTSAQEALKKLQ